MKVSRLAGALGLLVLAVSCQDPTLAGSKAVNPPSVIDSAAEVSSAKAVLDLSFAAGDTSSAVTQNITLPATAAGGVTVTWSSSQPAVLSGSGFVVRPAADAVVTLTATLTKGSTSLTKSFSVTVKAVVVAPPVPVVADPALLAADVALVKANLALTFTGGDSSSSVSSNLSLPQTVNYGVAVVWSSSVPAVLGTDGVIHRAATDTAVSLTATLTKGAVTDTKVFPLTVKAVVVPNTAAASALSTAKASLVLGFSSGDSASAVTQTLTLPTSLSDGVSAVWSSTNTGAVRTDGSVYRHGWDVAVTLTATLTKDGVLDTKSFNVTVTGLPVTPDTFPADVTADAAALALTFAPGQSAAAVTADLGPLPTSGANGSQIKWTSSLPATVSPTGVWVAPPMFDTAVTMTASVAKGGASAVRSFTFTAKANPSIVGAVTLSADRTGKKYVVRLDSDIDHRNGQVALIEGVVSGSSIIYKFENVPAGSYYLTCIVDTTGAWGPKSSGAPSAGQDFALWSSGQTLTALPPMPWPYWSQITVVPGGAPKTGNMTTWVYASTSTTVDIEIQ